MKTISESRRTMHSKLIRPLLVSVCAGLLSWAAPHPVAAATFPARGDDSMFSMGVFRVVVVPSFHSLMEPGPGLFGYPGYVSADGRLTSPKLLDFSTIVGRSDPHNRPLAGATAIGNPSMGNFGYGDYPIIPFSFGGAPAGTREILTRIRNLALNTSNQECSNHFDPRVPSVPISHRMVYAGPMQGVARPSLGMVQELVVNGAADPDFPARSFFDVFVEVNLPAIPGTASGGAFPAGGAVLYNDLPLIVSNTNVTSLPPQVVYIHGESTAVPLKFRDNNAPYWNAGDIFGYLVLAGHGTDNGCPTAEEQRGLLDVVLGPIGGAPANEMPIEWEFPTDRCPPPGATYDSVKVVDIIEFRTATGLRVQARNFSHSRLDNPIIPPPLGGTANYSDAATQIDAELSTDGGNTWFMAVAMGGVNVSMTHQADSGGVAMFDTEILSMNLTGNSPAGAFRLRESPTRPSLGKHTLRPTGGSFLVSSFFDVALELSIDNGQTWIPANRPIRVQLVSPCETVPPQVISVSADCDLNRITVQFSEPMDPVSTGNAGNYTLGSVGSVTSVALNATGDGVVLTTIDLACDKQYTLQIRGVQDKCGNTIVPNPTTNTFVCPPCKVAKWSQLPGFIVFPTSPNRHGEDRPSNFDWQGIMEGAVEPNQVIAEDFRSDGRPILCVRWWGSYMPGFEPHLTANSFFEDGYVLSFFSNMPGPAGTRPDKLLGTYVAPLSSVRITPTRFIGCDSNRIWQYEVLLKDTCLEHADPSIATPEAFLEQRGVIYWLSIAAEVGHRVIPLTDSDGNIVKWEQEPTGKRADKHFWGWHTSPRFELEVSMNGHVFMQGPEWIYPSDLWRRNQPLCNELDQAFELLTGQPPCETNRPTVISVDVNCDTDTVTVTYSEAMDPATAGNPGNYGIGVGIISVSLNAAGTVATIKTGDLKCDGTYEFSVRSVTDLCTNVINPNPQFFALTCPPCPEPKVSKWSQLPGEFIAGTAGAPRGADRPSDFDWVTLMQSGTTIGNPNWVVAEDFRSDGRPILCVRWWGSYMPGFEPSSPFTAAGLPPSFFEDGYVLSFFSDLRPAGGGPGRPDQLLGTYIAPLSAVKITRTQFIGCDQLPIWQYEVALEDTCLEHASAIATPRAFLERSNIVYWLAITAEVGLRVVPTTDPAGNNFCRKELTGKRADRHFWGWHTTIYQRESPSVMGHVFMPGNEWVYPSSLWMPNQPLCNQIAQAFELLTLTPPCETNPPTVISVTADCDSNKVTVVYSEPMDPGTAGSLANYFSGPGYTITSVMLNAAGDTAMLFTTDLVCGTNYTLTIRGVRDLCTNTINPNPQTFTFVCPPCVEPKEPKFSQLPGYLLFPTSPHQRGVNRPSNVDWQLIMNDTVIQPNAVVADDWVSNGKPILCVRWWGSYMRTNYEPTTATSTGGVSTRFYEDGYLLSFFSGFIGGSPGRPEKLLGSYVAPIEAVKVTRTPFFGCDGHRIYQYEVALEDTCLDHRVANIARPSAFLERPRGYYFLSIAAEVGHRVIPLRNNQGVIVDWAQQPTNKRATNHFWGWHTSPSNSFSFSVTGNLLMPGTEWVYERWLMNDAICNERDQAFELLTGPLDCPPRPTLSIVRSGDNVVISWVGAGYTLQATSVLTTPEDNIAWTDLTTTSPVTLPILFTQNLFFRLICP